MERCANTEALNRYEKQMEENEKQVEQEIKDFKLEMEDFITMMVCAFNVQCKSSNINRNELRNILLEGLESEL